MKKLLKYGLLGFAIALVLIVGVVSYFMATFNPNAYKPQIIQAVKDNQNRILKLDGDIKLTIFPSIGAKVDRVSLSEHKSSKEFASIESARVSLALLPLFSKQVVVNEVVLNGVKVHVVKFRDGKTNLDDLTGKQENKEETRPEVGTRPDEAIKFDIAGVTIENTELSYRDESTGAQYAVKNLNLKTGRIANGVPGKISLDALIQANKPQLDIAAKLKTGLTFDLEKQLYQLEDMDFKVIVTGDMLPNKSVSSEIKGSVQVDAARETVQVNLHGALLQSQVKAKLELKGFAEPIIRFDVDVDQFDADLYLPKKSAAAEKKSEAVPEEPYDLTALRKLNLDGSLRLGSLKVANVKSTLLRIDVKANKGLLNINPLSANLYQGSLNGSIAVNAAQATPTFTVKQNLSGVQVGMLIKDAVDLDMIEGKGNVAINIATQGNTVSGLKKGLSGTAGLNLADGAIKGINLGKLVHGAQNLGQGGGVALLKPVAGDKTDFTEFKANFKLNKGVAHNDDLLVKSQSLRISGNGDVDIGNSSINYAVKATLADSVDVKKGSLTVPVQLSGTFADLKFKVDYGAVAADVAKQKIDTKVEEKKEELKQQLQEKLKGGLKDLFK